MILTFSQNVFERAEFLRTASLKAILRLLQVENSTFLQSVNFIVA